MGKRGTSELEGQCIAFSMENEGSRKIILFRVLDGKSIVLNENGTPLDEVIRNEHIDSIYFPLPLGGGTKLDSSEFWFDEHPSDYVNGSSKRYHPIKKGSEEARALEKFEVVVRGYGILA